jgi:hypothetical protein
MDGRRVRKGFTRTGTVTTTEFITDTRLPRRDKVNGHTYAYPSNHYGQQDRQQFHSLLQSHRAVQAVQLPPVDNSRHRGDRAAQTNQGRPEPQRKTDPRGRPVPQAEFAEQQPESGDYESHTNERQARSNVSQERTFESEVLPEI